MEYIGIQQAAQQWGITVRRAQELCKSGMIPGATHLGRAWMIPKDASRPVDGRTRAAKAARLIPAEPESDSMRRKSPHLIQTDIYNTPGTADGVLADLEKNAPESARILRAQLQYQRGNIDEVYREIVMYMRGHSGFYADISAGFMLARCAVWWGDISLWHRARAKIFNAPSMDESQQQAKQFWLAVADSILHDTREFPDWFRRGIFDPLPDETYCVARMYYMKYLFVSAHDLATGKIELQDVTGLGLMRTLPNIIEPMICQARVERTLIPQVYMRLMAATVYHNLGEKDRAVKHIDAVLELVLPDRLYVGLVEYRRNLDTLLDDRLALVDPEALQRVRELYGEMNSGWIKLHNQLLERSVSDALTVREHEVAKLAAFGFANAEIAQRLHIELSSVKRYIFSAMNKVGAQKRSELGKYI